MKTTPSFTRRLFVLAAATLAVVCMVAPRRVSAQVVTPNPAPTIITTAPYTITKAGFYQLGKDLYYAGNGTASDAIISVNASNVTLDFAGHYISGPSTNTATQLYGVFASEQGNLNIQNGTIAFCYIGVYLSGNGNANSLNINQRITNLLISYCYYEAIDLESVRGADIFNNRISLIGGQIASDTWGFFGSGTGMRLSGNSVVNISAASSFTSTGIEVDTTDSSQGGFIYGNQITGAANGIVGGKYQQNLIDNSATPLSGGVNAGLND